MSADKKQNTLISICKPLYLGSAAYLKNELHKKQIPSVITPKIGKKPCKQPIYSVLVEKTNLKSAMDIKLTVLPEAKNDTENLMKKSRLQKAVIAGVLGTATGARIGVKFKDHIFWPIFLSVMLGTVSFFGTWWLWPSGPKKHPFNLKS